MDTKPFFRVAGNQSAHIVPRNGSDAWHEGWEAGRSEQPKTVMFSSKLNLLSNAMTAYARRMDAISGNIANLDTPGYRRINVSFEERLQEVMQGPGGEKNAATVNPSLELGEQAPVLEDELMDMADTQMRNQMAARALHDHFGMLRTGITGRTG